MRSRIWILLWILGILFPMTFLGSLWPSFGKIFDAVFAPGWTHILMHAILYAVLACLLAQWLKPVSARGILLALGLALLVGCAQEAFQLVLSAHWPAWTTELFDLGVDLVGASTGLLLARWFYACRTKRIR